MKIFGSGKLETKEANILLLFSIFGILYYAFTHNISWEIGIIIVICFCLPFLCDVLGYILHKWLILAYKKLTR